MDSSIVIEYSYDDINELYQQVFGKDEVDDSIKIPKIIHKCIFDECSIVARYNYKTKYIPIYCDIHKLDNMVNKNGCRCLLCDKYPSFNYSTETAKLYCADHKLPDMVNLHSINQKKNRKTVKQLKIELNLTKKRAKIERHDIV